MRETEILRGLTKAKQNCFQAGMVPSRLDELRARLAAENDPRRQSGLRQLINDAEYEETLAAKRAPVAPQPQVVPSQMPGVVPAATPVQTLPAPQPTMPVRPVSAPQPTLRGAAETLRGRSAESMGKKYGFERGTPFVEAPRGVSKDGDHVPAMLEHGEAVLPKATVAAVGAKSIQRLIEETTGRSPKQGLRSGLRAVVGMTPTVEELVRGVDLELDPAKAAKRTPPPPPPVAAVDPVVAAENARNARAAIDAQARTGAQAAAQPAAANSSKLARLRQTISGKHTTALGDLVPSAEKLKSLGRGSLGLLRGTLPIAGIEGAVRGFGTGTDEYAERMGVEPPQSFAGDVGLRAAGVLSDVGAAVADAGLLIPNLFAHGLDAKNWMSARDRFADVKARKAAAAATPAAATPAAATPAAATPAAVQPSPEQLKADAEAIKQISLSDAQRERGLENLMQKQFAEQPQSAVDPGRQGLRSLASNAGARNTFNVLQEHRGNPVRVGTERLADGRTVPLFSGEGGMTGRGRYTAADGTPTSDWTKTRDYAEGVKRAEKDKLDAAMLDAAEGARTQSGAAGEREKQAALGRMRVGLEAARAKSGLSANDVLTHQREMLRIGQAQQTAAQEGARKDRGEMMDFLKASYADEKGNVPPGIVQGFKEFDMHWTPDSSRSPEDNRAQMIKEFKLDRQLRELAAKGFGNDAILQSGTPIKFQKDKAYWGDFGSGGNWLNALLGGNVLRGPDGQVIDYGEVLNTPEMAEYLDKLAKLKERK